MVFAEGEEEKVIRAAIQWHAAGAGGAVLIGRERRIQEILAAMGLREPGGLEVHNARLSEHNAAIPTSSTNACNAKAISAATASAW